VAQHPFPGPGHDGDEPTPGVPARDGADQVGERYLDYLAAEIEAGREEPPPEAEPAPAVTVSLGEAGDVDLDELAAAAQGLSAGFAQDQAADVMPPGPVLGALAGQAAEDLAALDGDELLGVVLAARRLQARDEYLELAAIAEYARRCDQAYEASRARGDKPRKRDGEFAAEELGMELTCSHYAAGNKEEAARKHRRVEARQEGSGNAALSGRELAVDEALTAKNSVWAEAAALCNAGLDVPLREARTIVYTAMTPTASPTTGTAKTKAKTATRTRMTGTTGTTAARPTRRRCPR
jgi:hypothetical protein